MIHLYYGCGKGKTTSSIGLALRSLSAGIKVVIVQFLKNKPTGEIAMIEKMDGVTVFRGKAGTHFTKDMTREELERTKEISDKNLSAAIELCARYVKEDIKTAAPDSANNGVSVLLVLDEICAAYDENLVDRSAVKNLINKIKSDGAQKCISGDMTNDENYGGIELVLTGRNPPHLFKKYADYITEFKKRKHPFDRGITARKGIEY